MAAATTSQVYACLGDSITHGHQSRGNMGFPSRLDIALFSAKGASNHGVLSNTLSQMNTRYLAEIKAKGFYGIVLLGGVNDIITGSTGAAAFTAWNLIVTDALAAGLKVVGCTVAPYKTYAGWTVGQQTHLETLNAAIRARTPHANFAVAEIYNNFGAVDPMALKTAYQGTDLDGLHWGDGGCQAAADIIHPVVISLG